MAETTYPDRMRHQAQRAGRFGGRLTTLRNTLAPWWFLLPALAFFVGYQAYPIVRVLWISFTDYQYLSSEPAHFVGIDNYVTALEDPLMWASLWRATLFTIMFLPGTIVLPLLLAVLVDRVASQRLATVYRVILLIPAVIP
ncbi:MAG: carbohydrate ABC transporter permease, partial [Parvibaculaceae bacterium]